MKELRLQMLILYGMLASASRSHMQEPCQLCGVATLFESNGQQLSLCGLQGLQPLVRLLWQTC